MQNRRFSPIGGKRLTLLEFTNFLIVQEHLTPMNKRVRRIFVSEMDVFLLERSNSER